MSTGLIARSPDLKRLRDDGYDIVIRNGYLLVRDVPYVNSDREVKRGVLVSPLKLSGDRTAEPGTHTIHFSGDHPCHTDGTKITQIENTTHQGKVLADGITVDHRFSAKPEGGRYENYYHKVTTYVRRIEGPARSLDPDVTACTFPVVSSEDGEDSVFHYIDTASSRAEIVNVSKKLELGAVAIVGLGGTGSYVLDLVAKTPVREIHLIDGDDFHQHNAFRAPGAPSREQLAEKSSKVAHFQDIYSQMHKNISAHDFYLDRDNLELLEGLDFAFLCFDNGPIKREAIETLLESGTPFIDVGMGLSVEDDSIRGQIRVTAGTPEHSEHVLDGKRISFAPADEDDEYATNIQVADLNALNAALAVIKWKKFCGFYLDDEGELHSVYTLSGNDIVPDEVVGE